MKIKTQELNDAALDWAVAKAADYLSRLGDHWMVTLPGVHARMNFVPGPRCVFSPSTRWAQGGPLIEREKFDVVYQAGGRGDEWTCFANDADDDLNSIEAGGPTPLVAAMRCFITSQLGDEVDIPEELT